MFPFDSLRGMKSLGEFQWVSLIEDLQTKEMYQKPYYIHYQLFPHSSRIIEFGDILP